MKNNKGITLASLVIYIALIFVVLAILMRITTYFSSNITDMADVSFETEFNKLNIYLLDESKKSNNGIQEITEDGAQITFSNGNKYTYNAENKTIYLNNNIKICENIETCLFEKKTAENGKNVLELTIKIGDIEKIVNYTIKNTTQYEILLPAEYQEVEYIESTGTQYIDTGITCNENLKIDVKYMISSFDTYSNYIFGVYGVSSSYRVQYSHDSIIFAGFGNMYNNSITAPTEEKQYHLIMDNGKFILDGEEIYDATSAGGKYSSTNRATITLFARNGNGSIGYFGLNKIYECKMYIGETLQRNFIPCYRKSDGVVGMYDIVNDVFYTNAGTGTFKKGANVVVVADSGNQDYINEEDYIFNMGTEGPVLPVAYQQVEYIQSTGTQYIDTGITCNENLKIDVQYMISSFDANRSYIFGVYGASSSYRVQYSHTSVIFAGFGNMYNNTITAPTEEKQYHLIMDNGEFTLDGEIIYDATSAGGKYVETNTETIVLFACNSNGTIDSFGSNRIYECKIYIGETLQRNFIPCYRKSDNVIGLYDTINDVFYTNAGTGTFEKGANVD